MSNSISVTGNASVKRGLGQTGTGDAAFSFSIADTARKQVNEEWVDGTTTWFEVQCYRRQAEQAAELVKNGQQVTVVGRLETSEWTDSDGAKRSKLVVRADEIALSIRFGLK